VLKFYKVFIFTQFLISLFLTDQFLKSMCFFLFLFLLNI